MTRRKLIDTLLYIIIGIVTALTVGVLLWIVFYIVSKGISGLSWNLLSTATRAKGSIFPQLMSTLYIVATSVVISTPIGVCAAIYLTEYAKPGRLVRIIRFATESLAGIPSIIFGLFGMILFVITFKLGFSLIAGALTLSIMVLPTIVRTTEEALKSVPQNYREGSLALGASKIRTITKVVLPSALPGIITAIILSIGRIIGESAAVFMTAGMVPKLPQTLMNSGRTLSVHLYLLAKEGAATQETYATATVLLIVVVLINIFANLAAKRLRKRA